MPLNPMTNIEYTDTFKTQVDKTNEFIAAHNANDLTIEDAKNVVEGYDERLTAVEEDSGKDTNTDIPVPAYTAIKKILDAAVTSQQVIKILGGRVAAGLGTVFNNSSGNLLLPNAYQNSYMYSGFNELQCYVNTFLANLTESYAENSSVEGVNYSTCGYSLKTIADTPQYYSTLVKSNDNIIIYVMGEEDMVQTNESEHETSIKKLYDKVTTSGKQFILVSPPPFSNSEVTNIGKDDFMIPGSKAYNLIKRICVKYRIPFADFYTEFLSDMWGINMVYEGEVEYRVDQFYDTRADDNYNSYRLLSQTGNKVAANSFMKSLGLQAQLWKLYK